MLNVVMKINIELRRYFGIFFMRVGVISFVVLLKHLANDVCVA